MRVGVHMRSFTNRLLCVGNNKKQGRNRDGKEKKKIKNVWWKKGIGGDRQPLCDVRLKIWEKEGLHQEGQLTGELEASGHS